MALAFLGNLDTVRFARWDSTDPLAYRWYDADRVVLGRPLRECLRFAVACWHSLAMDGSDPFGAPTLRRPWMGRTDAMQAAREKADAAFELFRMLDVPLFTFHDRDIAPEGNGLRGHARSGRSGWRTWSAALSEGRCALSRKRSKAGLCPDPLLLQGGGEPPLDPALLRASFF